MSRLTGATPSSPAVRRFVDLHRFMGRTTPGDSCLAVPEHKDGWVKNGLMSWDGDRGAWVLTQRGATLLMGADGGAS